MTRLLSWCVAGGVCLLSAISPAAEHMRTWTSKYGTKSFQAHFVSAEDYVAVVRLPTGKTSRVPFVAFGFEDRRFLERKQAEAETRARLEAMKNSPAETPATEGESLAQTIAEANRRLEEGQKQREVADAKALERARARCPLLMTRAGVARSQVLRSRSAVLEVKNLEGRAIVAYKATLECFNRFDEPVDGFLDDNDAECISQTTIGAHATQTSSWTLDFRDNAAIVKITMQRIRFRDGTEWNAKPGKPYTVTAESNE